MPGRHAIVFLLCSIAIANRHAGHWQGTTVLEPRSSDFDPGQHIPPLTFPTLSGSLNLADLFGIPVLFNAFVPGWGFSDALWRGTDSIDDFIARAPSNAHFVFLSYGESTAEESVRALRALFSDRISRAQEHGDLLNRMHFVNASVEQLGAEASSAWLPSALRQYPTYFDNVEAQVGPLQFNMSMLNARYDWLGWSFMPSRVFGNSSVNLASGGNACSEHSFPMSNMSGRIALVDDGDCDYYTKARLASMRHAAGVAVVATSRMSPLVSMNCFGSECQNQSFGLPMFMVPYEEGQKLRRALSVGDEVTLKFHMSVAAGTDIGVDAAGRLRQTWGGSGLGNLADRTYGNPGDVSCKLYPSLAFVAWAAQWLNFQQAVVARLSIPAHVVTVFETAALGPRGNCYGSRPWGCGPSAVVDVPSANQLGPLGQPFTSLELDFALGCGDGLRDIDCPKWDHVVTLLGCCGSRTESFSCDASRGFELGRWITSFSRGVGHWVTHVSPLMPLLVDDSLGPQACNLTMFSVPWAGNHGSTPWTSTLKLRFLEPPAPPAWIPFKVLQPWSSVSTSVGNGVYQYFKWIAFNQTYEQNFVPFEFSVPAGTEYAQMLVVLSGHGNDNHGCGEFCSTDHYFTLNGHVNVKHNRGPDNQELGCADSVSKGTTPNEYGTWLYGRDGWCNGRDVEPWTIPVTNQLRETNNTLAYRGLYNGSIPDPSSLQQGAPVMMIRVYLVFYKQWNQSSGAGLGTVRANWV